MDNATKVGFVVKARVEEGGKTKMKTVSGVMVSKDSAEKYRQLYLAAHPNSEAYIAGTND